MKTVQVRRHDAHLWPNNARVILRPLIAASEERIRNIVGRVLSLSEREVESLLGAMVRDFGKRHINLEGKLKKHFKQIEGYLPAGTSPTASRRLLLGSYFTCEYSIESAGLFNPSIVPHFDQANVPAGALRFIMSLRATGEGHISSIEFRTGTVDKKGDVVVDEPSRHAMTAPIESATATDYEMQFSDSTALSERVLFPISESEKNGIEDARFVRFNDAGGKARYYATYTAYDGRNITSRLLETEDFKVLRSRTLVGQGVQNKGMALFPRKLNGNYAMISRQDGEHLFIMYSDDIGTWNERQKLLAPTFPWEFIQIGNCGSPIETERGWLLLTHGVGPLRKYSLGAILLDLEDPSKMISRLEKPLLSPDENEREGYVPNVVYTCGALPHLDTLILPYAASDYSTKIASVSIRELLDAMV